MGGVRQRLQRMNPARHVMIMASAGSGKTYALTSRFVALLAAGAMPDRIVALTFTRKAAGEFFDEILQKLARAARDESAARRLAEDIGQPGLTPRDFLRLLRGMIDAMHRLRLGTLDSFFARVARSFPLELGLTGEFEILQEHASRIERRRVLRRMFARTGGGLAAAQNEFIEAFKRATFGTEEKRLGARLDAFLDQHQENFLAAPEGSVWGDPTQIWPEGSRWLQTETKLTDAVRALRPALGALTDGQRLRWENFFAALEEWTPGAPLPAPVEYILKNALAVWKDVCAGCAEMTVERRKLALPAEACRALEQIITHIVGAELRRRIETTRGIHAVLQAYEANYHDAVRRTGKLTFADVQRLLVPVALTRRATPENAEAEAARLFLDYRLDAEIDHWLLDEFQDTSFGQWSVLRNLIDEVVQDVEGRRSFFCVGDVKQAIYAWREGDPRLLREIFDHYNRAAAGTIEERHLTDSWRSGPPLIEMVNAVFGQPAVLAELFPGAASTTWNSEWRTHRSAVPQRTGQAALLLAVDENERWTLTRRLIETLRPLERGLTCAVLVKRNDTAAQLADFLRRAGIAAVAESDLHIATDNPLGTTLLALVQAAAHPGDTLAQEHVRMTPVGAMLAERGLATPDALARFLLSQIHADGFERALEFWIAAIEPRLAADDAFSRLRAQQLVAAAGVFDATGSRDVDEFIAFMERHTVRSPESAAVVRVMTVHKAKGLGFDLVVLPDLEGSRIDERRDGLAVQKAADRSVQWILDLPPKLFYAQDAVLAAHVREAEAEAGYENLSLLYVALTRAKRGLYVITEPPGDSTSRNFPRLLAATLGEQPIDVLVGSANFAGTWASGDPHWAESNVGDAKPDTPARWPVLAPLPPTGAARAMRRVARQASTRPNSPLVAGGLFSMDGRAAAEFGSALHALLAEVEWAEPGAVESWAAVWRTRPTLAPAVIAAARDCLTAPDLTVVWRPPSPTAEVWRERSFEVVLDGAWLTGVFDRVVVDRDTTGRARAVTVFDFKTDRVKDAADTRGAVARYAVQLNTYRRVAAVLAGVPLEAVGAEIVFTAINRRAVVPFRG
jgi:ATP-dependent helicase/nuclease subunit A